jgi:heat shock protein HtpX
LFHDLSNQGTAPEETLRPIVARLAYLAGMQTPSTLIVESSSANALAIPIRKTPSVVVVTTGLLDLLEPQEVEAVVAHELSHIANHDGEVLTFVGGPALAIGEFWASGNIGWRIFALLLSPLWLLSFIVMRAVSRYREFTADRGSAVTPAPPSNSCRR